jgi:hypothetical protein
LFEKRQITGHPIAGVPICPESWLPRIPLAYLDN